MKDLFKVVGAFVAVGTAIFLFLVWSTAGFSPVSTLRGQLAARIDIKRGHYKELAWGMPVSGADKYARLLKERYGIDFHYIAFCTASKSERDYADAYDAVSMEAVRRKFGHEVFKETWDEIAKSGGAGLPTR